MPEIPNRKEVKLFIDRKVNYSMAICCYIMGGTFANLGTYVGIHILKSRYQIILLVGHFLRRQTLPRPG